MKPISRLQMWCGLVFLCGMVQLQALNVVVSIPPQAAFVKAVAADRANVQILLEPGRSPELYSPSARRMTEVSRADIYFAIGVPMENVLLPKLKSISPQLTIVNTIAKVPLRTMEEGHFHHDHGHDHAHHDHDADHDDDHKPFFAEDVSDLHGRDPHTWLSPKNAILQVESIAQALISLDPKHKDDYLANANTYIAKLHSLDDELSAQLKPYAGKTIYVYHPSFGYFTDSYGLKQSAVETGGKAPSSRDLSRLIESARSDNARIIFVQPQFPKRSAEVVARSIRGKVMPLDGLAEDYAGSLRAMANAIEEAFKGE